MPFVRLTTTKTLTLHQEKELKRILGELITILPNKKEETLMIHIEDNQVMYFKGTEDDCMKIGCQLLHTIELSYKQEFTRKLTREIEKLTKIPVSNQYLTIEEFEHWGKGGEFM